MDISLGIRFCGVNFPNPFVVSQLPPSGDPKIMSAALEAGWGGIVLRPASLEAEGESLPREQAPLYRGVDFEEKRLADLGWIEHYLPESLEKTERIIGAFKQQFPNRVIIASMIGYSREEWLKVSRKLHQAGADLIECDFSRGSGQFASQYELLAQDLKLIEKVSKYVIDGARTTPVIAKLPGTFPNRAEMLEVLKESGIEAITVFYEPKGIPGINLNNFIPFPNVGNKSTLCVMGGTGVKPFALGMLSKWGLEKPGLQISVQGGAYTWRDAVEFLLMGASMVQFHGAVLQKGIGLIDELKSGVSDYLEEKMISAVNKLVGKSLPFISAPDKLPRNMRVAAAINEKLCVRCGICYKVCEGLGYHAINFSNQRKPYVDKKKCVGDGLCVASCPVTGCMNLHRIAK